ncbi:ABC transporter permease [Caproicibacter sp.]|uniref:ABC transporter permease n=1 Tax=Caproicibacter sp. TaxID=2814884 RepID=UPI003988E9F5
MNFQWMRNGNSRTNADKRFAKTVFLLVTALFLLYIMAPVLATLFFSLSQKWTNTILPQIWSTNAYAEIFNDPDFYEALGRTVALSTVVACLDVMITVLALFGVETGSKKAGTLIEVLSIIPIALPGVVLALGSIKFYGAVMPQLLGTPYLLAGVQTAFNLPFCYWTMSNAYRAIDAGELYSASKTLACGTVSFLIRILFPSLKKGVLISGAIAFAGTFDNYALQQLITGAGWKTFSVFQYNFYKVDGHLVSALSVIAMLVIFAMSILAGYASGTKREK